MPEAFTRETYPGDVSDPAALLELTLRIRQDLRDWSVHGIVLLETTKYANWSYSQAQQRVLCVAAVMLAAAEEGIHYEVSRAAIAGAHVLSPKLENFSPDVIGLGSAPKYWTTGAREAYAAAAFAARDR
ncbi:hypothetical protein [Microbacterium sp. SLBN-111]|uniref:hypothetical protein n=1 Tax=Microbacterium sp. SLBN-111 TaxID=3377733 RepID=UPI003C70D10E